MIPRLSSPIIVTATDTSLVISFLCHCFCVLSYAMLKMFLKVFVRFHAFALVCYHLSPLIYTGCRMNKIFFLRSNQRVEVCIVYDILWYLRHYTMLPIVFQIVDVTFHPSQLILFGATFLKKKISLEHQCVSENGISKLWINVAISKLFKLPMYTK